MHPIRLLRRGLAGLLLALLGGLLPCTGAAAPTIDQVRVGRHADKVRIVLEATETGPFEPIVDTDGRAVRVPFASVTWRAETAKEIAQVPYLAGYRFEPAADGVGGALVIDAVQPVRVLGAFVIGATAEGRPPRYVLDLAPAQADGAAPAEAVEPGPASAPAESRGMDPAAADGAEPGPVAATDAPVRPEHKPTEPTATVPTEAPIPARPPASVRPGLAEPSLGPAGAPVPGRKPVPGGLAVASGPESGAEPPALPPVVANPAALDDAALAERLERLEQAAVLGDVEAMRRLGRLALSVPEARGGGPALAFAWYRKAAELADAESAFEVGQAYRTGRGVPRSDALAAYWYGRAAEAGSVEAQVNLAVLKLRGLGYGVLPDSGADLLRKAAEQGNARAQALLDRIDATGALPEDESAFLP